MSLRNPIRPLMAFFALAVVILVLPAAAKDFPKQLPDPDGKAGDAARPVKVYLLAGQSNMIGMGTISGARCRYTDIYLTADPDVPKGPMDIYRVGIYKVDSFGVYLSADSRSASGATVSIYKGAYDEKKNYDRVKPAKTQEIALGVAGAMLPAISGPHTHVVRGYVEVPASGIYRIRPGFGDSSYNVMELDENEVYHKPVAGKAVKMNVALTAGKRYAVKITYFKGGSTAFWMSQMELLGKGDLEVVTKRENKFPNLLDEKGEWTVRHDVYYYDARNHFKGSPLSPTSNGRTIGPELGFGHVMGTYHEEQVLLIKTAMGNRALGFDFRPPSSGRNAPDNKWESLEYKLMIEGVHKTLDTIKDIVPGYQGQGYEMAGFVWWQGHKDGGTPEWAAEYEKNLTHLIQDVRAEFKAPKMFAVVATVGFGGYNMSERYIPILNAQMAVSDPKKHPEFAGNVRSVDTRDFWRDVDESPVDQDYHYNRNAETYLLVGDALGNAMVDLIEGVNARPFTPVKPVVKPVEEPVVAKTPEQKAKVQVAIEPIILEGILPQFLSNPRTREALLREASGEKAKRVSPFLRGEMYGLNAIYNAAGIHEYDWHAFGPDLKNSKWDYYSFDPREKMARDKSGARFRNVTYPPGMANWYAVGFDAAKAGWKRGLPPFGQNGGKLEKLSEDCTSGFCGCGNPPRTLWEEEVLLLRGTFEVPPFKEGYRYRIVVGGSAHVNAGEGYAIYVNGKPLMAYPRGVGRREGGQPRGAFIDKETLKSLKGSQLTIAAMSFLTYHSRGVSIPPRGHISLWLEEMKIPPLDK